MNRAHFIFYFLITTAGTGFAAKPAYEKLPTCGTAKVTEGDTCSNVKVEFDFQSCALKSEPQIAKRVLCEKNTITARYQKANYRYEASFEKVVNWKGGVVWKPLGEVAQSEKIGSHPRTSVAAMATPEPKAERFPATEVSSEVVHSTIASEFKFGAYVDFRYSTFSAGNDPNVANPNAESGFGIEEGALSGNFDQGKIAGVMKLAFRRLKDQDSTATNPPNNQSSTNTIALAVDKSLLFLKYKFNPMFTFDVGQFDTPYGLEASDSKDRVFGKFAFLSDYMIPFSHTGAMVEWANSGATAKLLAANPSNRGSTGSATTAAGDPGDDKTEYGATVGYANEIYRGQLGYLTRPIRKASVDGRGGFGDRSLLDLTLGATLGPAALDFEYARVNDSYKNSLTPSNPSDSETAGEGWMFIGSYKLTTDLQLGARYENVKDDPAYNSAATFVNPIASLRSWGVSVHYKLTPELETRAEYIDYDFKGTDPTASTWKDNRFNVAGVLAF